jgi:hypothetical protein
MYRGSSSIKASPIYIFPLTSKHKSYTHLLHYAIQLTCENSKFIPCVCTILASPPSTPSDSSPSQPDILLQVNCFPTYVTFLKATLLWGITLIYIKNSPNTVQLHPLPYQFTTQFPKLCNYSNKIILYHSVLLVMWITRNTEFTRPWTFTSRVSYVGYNTFRLHL